MPSAARTLPTAPARALLLLAPVGAIVSCSLNDDWISLIGKRGFEPGQFFRPAHLAVDAAGFLYVADTDNHRVQKLTPNGDFVAAFGAWGSGPGQFLGLSGLAVVAAAPDGSIFVADTVNHRIQHFSSDGDFIGAWGREGRHPGEFRKIRALAVDSQGSVYVADRSNYRVQVIGPNGAFVDAIEVGYVGVGKRAIIGPLAWASGSLYAADSFNHVVPRMDLKARQAR